MPMIIVIPAARHSEFYGEVTPGHVIDPRQMVSGDYCVGAQMLTDPGYAPLWPALSELEVRELRPDDFPPPEDEEL